MIRESYFYLEKKTMLSQDNKFNFFRTDRLQQNFSVL